MTCAPKISLDCNGGYPVTFDLFGFVDDAMVLSVAFCRVVLFLVTAEIVLRYFPWWRQSRGHMDTDVMSDLMLGVAWGAVGFCGFTILALTASAVPRDPVRLTAFFLFDAILTYAMVKHLVPAWRLGSRWRGHIGLCVTLRLVAAMIVAVVMVMRDLQ